MEDTSRQVLLQAGAGLARVDAQTPPAFIVHASGEGLVPVENSLGLHGAFIAAKRSFEWHIFDERGHGFGVRASTGLPGSEWSRLFTAFAARCRVSRA